MNVDYICDSMFHFDELNTYFEVHAAGIDGECFTYSVYFDNAISAQKTDEINNAINQWLAPYREKETYPGYISVTKEEDKASIYLDLGGVDDCDTSIYGIIKALNNVTEIKAVILNEDSAGA